MMMNNKKGRRSDPFLLEKRAKEKPAVIDAEELAALIKPVLDGLGLTLVEISLSRHKGATQVRATVYNGGIIGIDDCAKASRAMLPRLELAFGGPEADFSLEVSSPGTDRVFKNRREYDIFTGRGIKCYRTDISDWAGGILERADENGIFLKTKTGGRELSFSVIAKARLSREEEE
jgi:ribosome maturation factor RimP